MLLVEVLTTSTSWVETDNWAKQVEYEMVVQGVVYEILFTREPINRKDPFWTEFQIPEHVTHVWQLAFAPQRSVSAVLAKQPYNAYGITNTGNAITVFSTVLEVIDDFATKHHNQYVFFSAKERSRKRLYDRLVKRISTDNQVVDVGQLRHYIMKV